MSAASGTNADPLLDAVMVPAWAAMVEWLLGQKWATDQFTADTGIPMPITRPRTALDAAIDEACGYDPAKATERFLAAFPRWATETHWGSDEVTPGIAAALARLPAEVKT